MEDIALYIFDKYGYKLTIKELNIVIQWYEDNEENILDEADLDNKLRDFLYKSFPNKTLFLKEEDTSNMNYLLTMLKNRKNS